MKTHYVYIMANAARTIYIGVTSDLEGRVWQHKNGAVQGFTAQYGRFCCWSGLYALE